MESIKILVIEDEVIIADYINDILLDNGLKNVAVAHSVEEARQKITMMQPDIILMDINLEGRFEGIELVKEKNDGAKIIFITGQTDSKMIEDAIRTSPQAYLTKPIREVDLITAVRIIVNDNRYQVVTVKDGYTEIKLKPEEIIYIQADKNYLDIHSINRKITVRKTLWEFSKELPAFFKQIHRSVIINTEMIEYIATDEVLVKGVKLPISRKYRHHL